jgi:hypothetical protein
MEAIFNAIQILFEVDWHYIYNFHSQVYEIYSNNIISKTFDIPFDAQTWRY